MSIFADVSDVKSRIPGHKITAEGGERRVSDNDVQQWLDFAEDLVTQLLQALGIAIPAKSSKGANIIGEKILLYPEGMARKAFASSGGDGNNTDGDAQIEKFEAWCEDITERPAHWSAVLAPGGGASSSSLRMRGFPNDSTDQPPEFTRDEVF